MLRTRNDQPTLWESILPEGLLKLPDELERVDALLDDEAFFAPFRAHFDPVLQAAAVPGDHLVDRLGQVVHQVSAAAGG